MPLVALTLVVLLVCAGATFEVGRMALTKHVMQKAADLATTSAASQVEELSPTEVRRAAAGVFALNAYATAGSPPTPQAVGTLYSDDGSGSEIGVVYDVGAYRLKVWHPYSDQVTQGQSLPLTCLVCVEASRVVQLPFLAVVGLDSAPVRARAVAVGEPSGPCLIFAHSSDPLVNGLDWTSNGGTIHGDCHSNTRVNMGGSNHVVDGWIDYRYGYTVGGSGHDVQKGFRLGNVMDYPISYTPADFQYDYVYNNLKFPGHVIPAGVYYVKGKLHITGDDVAAGPVTFVVEGDISVVGTGHNFTAASNNILFYSLSSSSRAIDVSAQGGQWTGIFFAPNGHIQFSASGQHIYEGGIVGDTIEITGQDFTAEGTLPPLPRFFSRLVR